MNTVGKLIHLVASVGLTFERVVFLIKLYFILQWKF